MIRTSFSIGQSKQKRPMENDLFSFQETSQCHCPELAETSQSHDTLQFVKPVSDKQTRL